MRTSRESVDDNEAHHLRLLLNEVFGEENLVAAVVWQKRDTPANDAKGLSVTHEYILVYQRSEAFGRNLLPRSDEQIENYKNPDNDPRGPWTRTSFIRKEVRPDRLYEVKNRAGRVRVPPPGTSWRVVPSLTSRDFEVLDSGQPREILDLFSDATSAASVALLVDGSGSMRLGAAHEASQQISEAVLNSLDASRDDLRLHYG